MRVLWTFLKVVIALALAIPLSIIVLATALGILGALVGLAIMTLKIAIFGLIGYGVFRLIARLVGGSPKSARPAEIPASAPIDRHYEAAMRELDRELGETR
jgi:hypothetical protein